LPTGTYLVGLLLEELFVDLCEVTSLDRVEGWLPIEKSPECGEKMWALDGGLADLPDLCGEDFAGKMGVSK
jgi:hypothetical protein